MTTRSYFSDPMRFLRFFTSSQKYLTFGGMINILSSISWIIVLSLVFSPENLWETEVVSKNLKKK